MRFPRVYRRIMNSLLHILHRRLTQPRVIMLDNLCIQICPQVFHPGYGRTTLFFIQHMILHPQNRVLEIGTGTGAIAAAAARITHDVTATDVNPYAVNCAQGTMKLNKVETRVTVLRGDLFAPVQGEVFDVILFNPPYFDLITESWIGSAWAAGPKCELIDRFLVEARSYMNEEGCIQMLASSAAPLRRILRRIQEIRYRYRIIAQGRLLGFGEKLYLFQLW
ncbi:MAG: HemK2/MTQ2 family protein methyltransferase [Candidatus Hodarchaeota archaeon]